MNEYMVFIEFSDINLLIWMTYLLYRCSNKYNFISWSSIYIINHIP